jgi:hypothetical protein
MSGGAIECESPWLILVPLASSLAHRIVWCLTDTNLILLWRSGFTASARKFSSNRLLTMSYAFLSAKLTRFQTLPLVGRILA